VEIERRNRLTAEQVAETLELMTAVGDADGTYPLSEHAVLHLRHGGDVDVRHLLARDGAGDNAGNDGTLVGYGHVDVTDVVQGSSAEIAVHPDHRRHGLGRLLVEAALAASPDGRLRLWAHGEHPAAGALAASLGFERSRVLWQLRRSLLAPVAAPELADGVTLRPFRVGEDEDAWLRVNARAFADLPDQGGWTRTDLAARMDEPWFDPDGFLLAVRDGELLGFHWTKVHGSDPLAARHAHEPIGEVYVLGVDPSARGLRLGKALTLAGLRHLRGRGLTQAMLYVDAANEAAVRLYKGLGFRHWSTDVEYHRS
jgi:mycothiol synthase